MASPNLDEIVTTTLRNRSGVVADNVTNNIALLNRLNKRGRVKPFDGGRTIDQELTYAENSTYIRYSGYQTLNVSPSDVVSAAEYEIKQAAVAVTMSGLEELQNAGMEKVIDLLETRIDNAEATMQNGIDEDSYSNGTADSGKQIGGLQLLVADDPTTGTVGGINRASYSFWQNAKFQCSTDGGSAASAANIQGYMNTLYNSLVRGADRPDFLIGDDNYFGFYESSLQAIQRITDNEMGGLGFVTLQYKGVPFVLGGGKGGACPTNHLYMLNTRYLFLRPHSRRNMVPIGGPRSSVNQDATVRFLGWAGNMTTSNASLQGVMFEN